MDDPPNLGNKALPVAALECLDGHMLVIQDVLDSLVHEECRDLRKQYGAHVVSAVSRKVTSVYREVDAAFHCA